MTSSTDNNMPTIKQESGESNTRIQLLEDETNALKNDVKQFLSIIAIQTEQLARQEKTLNEMKDERNTKATNKAMGWLMVLLLVIFMLVGVIWIGYSFPEIFREDTIMYLNTKATPVKAPFITAGVKVSFTMGDLLTSVKGLFSEDAIDSLS